MCKNSVEFSVGIGGLCCVMVDSIGFLSQNLVYCLIVMIEEGDSCFSLFNNCCLLVVLLLVWVIDKDILLNYEVEFLQVSMLLDCGFINVCGVLGMLLCDCVLNEFLDGNMVMCSNMYQLMLECMLFEQWCVRLGVSYKESSFDGYYIEVVFFNLLVVDNCMFNCICIWWQLFLCDIFFQVELQGNFNIGVIGYIFLIGVEVLMLWMNMEILCLVNIFIDIYNLVYGSFLLLLINCISSLDEWQCVKGVFVQDQLSLLL